ncbi:unnamed protein product [Brachionus calyciflorus]|uniref:Peptidase M3A/M3B catalytic domain-containing protein n=1 Tax=Brachionus calyciflorus TaxID=104777 RepID=A0A813ZET0_9BILA|nr:unnamed protein product [Brachionus calyciflorus]
MSRMIGKIAKSQHLLKKCSIPLKITSRNNYYFLLPEIPSDTAETNELMRNDDIPSFNEITANKVQTGVQKLVVNFDTDFNELLGKLDKDKSYDKTFENVFNPIEKSIAPLDYAFKTARHLSFVYPYSKYHTGYLKLDHKVNLAKNERWTNRSFFKILKELNSNKHLMNDVQNRLVDRSIRNCVLNGLNLNDAEFQIFQELNNKIQEKQSLFKHRLNHANRKFELRISSQMSLNEIPSRIKKKIANDRQNPDNGPWTIIPNEEVFESFMKNCGNRSLRKTLFEAYYSRASYVQEQFQTNNSEVIKSLLEYRRKQANLYGYRNFAELVLENKAAVKIENVIDLFEKIKANIKPLVDEDLGKLLKFSAHHGNLIPFETYDIEYWKNKYVSHHFGIDEGKLSEYFPFRKVLNGLFEISKQLFNVEFKKDDSNRERFWDPKVESYKVMDDNGQTLSYLIIDPFIRNLKIDNIWSYTGRNSSELVGFKPLVYLNMNVRDRGEFSAMNFAQVKQLFDEFGGVIQTLLTKTSFTELSDKSLIETDALNLTNKLFNRLIYVPQIMKLISTNKNGDSLPNEFLERITKANESFKSFDLMKQTFLSAFDLECHISEKFWYEIMEDLWPKYMPIKLNKNDYRPCQFTSIFGENFGCNYYSLIWSEMLASDLFDAFNDTDFENSNKLLDVGLKYKKTFLESGSSLHVNEIFRRFRGRNPSIDPFIKSFQD